MNRKPGIGVAVLVLISGCFGESAPAVASETADSYYLGTQRSPDGRYSEFSRVNRRPNHEVKYVGLYIKDRRTGKARRIYRNEEEIHAPVAAGWWPNRRRVLFWTVCYGSGSINADGSSLYDVSVDGGEPRRLGEGMRHPECLAFSPDGQSLLLVEGEIRFFVTRKRIIRIDYRTGRRTLLTSPKMTSIEPAWSPDGKRIVYAALRDLGEPSFESNPYELLIGKQHLWLMRPDGSGKRTLLSDSRYHESLPHWVGSHRIRFTRTENNEKERTSQWEIRDDGTGLTQRSHWRTPPRIDEHSH